MSLDVRRSTMHPMERRAATTGKFPIRRAAPASRSLVRKISMRPAVTAALLASLALGACAHVRAPDLSLPLAYEAPQGAPPNGAIDLDRWWLAFNDSELTALIDRALLANPDARSAAARLNEARATRIEGLLRFLPQGDVSASTRSTDTTQTAGTVVNFPGFSSSGTTTNYIYGPDGQVLQQLTGTTPTYLQHDQQGALDLSDVSADPAPRQTARITGRLR